jgi:hypothetical protein
MTRGRSSPACRRLPRWRRHRCCRSIWRMHAPCWPTMMTRGRPMLNLWAWTCPGGPGLGRGRPWHTAAGCGERACSSRHAKRWARLSEPSVASARGRGPVRPRGNSRRRRLAAVHSLIGRDSELEVLAAMVDGIGEHGGSVVVLGEPGVGKSSLLRAMTEPACRSWEPPGSSVNRSCRSPLCTRSSNRCLAH